MTKVDLPAKGLAGCPAFSMRNGTHLRRRAITACRSDWPDDAEPGNNLGQENTDVKALNSPHATFTFPVRNDSGTRRILSVGSGHVWSA